ncbi:hypothetical protein P872_13150 [Rhodonellum psychrophilum GCM71 = DSM 17998]|uniref:Bacterial Pleckstrin homology domain-containing protein n=2 Tax=Rhodonellum TaxID=336827 RepID=U5BRP9_9BACT|nr:MULTISPECIES: hypothetical protein [Rhodonellum]ERM80568.1 hypothetical protein P872_13150 [Rhodonellum psychrophilum GCM71 = DSM 17998]SDY94796.1 hypothetical protein SAMN05444412_1048 [Rhodonellum ikkaensis]
MVVNDSQSFRGSFLMYGMIMLETPTLILIIVLWQTGNLGKDGPMTVGIVAGLMLLTFILLMSIKLDLRMDEKSLAFRFPPFGNKWKKIMKEDVQSINVKQLDGIFEYGGIGWRLSRKQTAYVFPADHVIEVQLNRKKLVFSTKKPKEVEEMIANWKEGNHHVS